MSVDEQDDLDKFCQAIKYAKRAMPELRIGQIISNSVAYAKGVDKCMHSDPFYISDKDLINAIYGFTNESH